jgi:hypothetical protein
MSAPQPLDLGPRCDLDALAPGQDRLALDPTSLTRHAVCLGATGSGKTGLCIGLLESVAAAGVPVLAIDPKGDLTNLALIFDDLDPARLAPWVPDPEAVSRRWQEALAAEGRNIADLAAWRRAVDVAVLTPGSDAGLSVDVLSALTRAPAGLADDPEGLREYVVGAVSALLGLIGRTADPMTDPPAILLARLLGDAFARGRALPMGELIPAVVDPPFEHVGYFPLETFLPREERVELARALNAVVSSPAFEAWRRGTVLDVDAWLRPTRGRTPVRVVYLAHLDDAQRMFFVTLLLHAVVAWTRRLPGASHLRALVYMDEVMGYLPPHPRQPPSKAPVLTLLKQARAVGVGMMLCTQNPVDMDYKAMSNAATWLIGRLATRQDRARVVDGLQDADDVGPLIARLPPRTFLLRSERGLAAFRSRQTLALLRGPLTRKEVGMLGHGLPVARPSTPPEVGLPQRWLSLPGIAALGHRAAVGAPHHRGLVYGRYRVRFRGAAEPVIVHRAAWADALGEVQALELQDGWLRKAQVEAGTYPAAAEDTGALREAWMAAVQAEAVWEVRGAALRGEVECVGVVWVWVGVEG